MRPWPAIATREPLAVLGGCDETTAGADRERPTFVRKAPGSEAARGGEGGFDAEPVRVIGGDGGDV